MTERWLEALILEGVSRRLCIQPVCSTCGSMEFRKMMLDRIPEAPGEHGPHRLQDPATATALLSALAEVRAPSSLPTQLPRSQTGAYVAAVRAIHFWISNARSVPYRETRELLGDSFAASVLSAMERHHAEQEARRSRHEKFNSPEQIEARRAEKARLRQEKMQGRRERKRERDRIWWETHEKPGKPPHNPGDKAG